MKLHYKTNVKSSAYAETNRTGSLRPNRKGNQNKLQRKTKKRLAWKAEKVKTIFKFQNRTIKAMLYL